MNALAQRAFAAPSSHAIAGPAITAPGAAKGPLGNSARQRREEAHDYIGTVAVLNPSWRVVRANREPLQWIIQQRRGRHNGYPIWYGRSFHQHRDSLIQRAGELAHIINAPGFMQLFELPAHIWEGPP